jgi:1-acyl-sn-glycerol-3-phosphate acyltransferase
MAIMRFGFGWRIEGAKAARREFLRLRRQSTSPLLVCANHLTMLDSFLIAWALAPASWYLRHYASLPWNTPERVHFARTRAMRALIYVMKCIPVLRGGDRGEVGRVLARVAWLLSRGEVALVFPEGGRSRTGRVDTAAATYGVGRLLKEVPGCRVLCVYLRGEGQEGYTAAPARGERFRVQLACLEPKSTHAGLRGSLELSGQILRCLAELERRHFEGRAA